MPNDQIPEDLSNLLFFGDSQLRFTLVSQTATALMFSLETQTQ